MAFNYDKNKQSHGNDSFWTSSSDLFLGLSTIFLLLYVTSSLRSGADSLHDQVENRKLTQKVQELESQLKTYESVKTDYLEKSASKDEVQEYQELMDKLTLLQSDAEKDRDRLAQEAKENDRKATALNKYQQMVRNVLNANKVAKSRIITRNETIKEQDHTIDQQRSNIQNLQTDIDSKSKLLAEGEQKISAQNEALKLREQDLKKAFKANRITKKAFDKKTAEIRAEHELKLRSLQATNADYARQIGDAQGQMKKLAGELEGTQAKLQGTEQKLAGTVEKLQGTEQKLAGTSAQLDGANSALANVKGKLKSTEGALAKAQAELEARRGIAKQIGKGFAKAGIKADIDAETGDVLIDFGDSYFENDSAHMKARMKSVLAQAMPVYSRSLLDDPKLAKQISAVEVVGFASPTYKGRFIDPESSNPDDRAAIKYNMDLSYRRANAIFNYLLDGRDMHFEHQKQLLGLMKVSARSFLEGLGAKNRGPATAAEFCKQNDCKKAQRVIIRFSMDGKTRGVAK